MISPNIFSIRLENPSGCYFSGQTVVGVLDIITDRPKEFQCIRLSFEGNAQVEWKDAISRNNSRLNGTIKYSAAETYFSKTFVIAGNANPRRGPYVIPTGITSYPFRFRLPRNLPSSFEGNHGSVSYKILVNMKRSWNKPDKNLKYPFTVNGILDLNLEPVDTIARPVELQKRKTRLICCGTAAVGSILLKISLPKTGFAVGESITATVELVNYSNAIINGLVIHLKQTVTFHSTTISKVDSCNVAHKVHFLQVSPGDSTIRTTLDLLQIPSVPPSRLPACSIIDIQYNLYVMVRQGHSNLLKLGIPVIIGNIPYGGTISNFSASPLVSSVPSTSVPPQTAASQVLEVLSLTTHQRGLPGYNEGLKFPSPTPRTHSTTINRNDIDPDIPPPTYIEAMKLNKNIQMNNTETEGMDNIAFSPEQSSRVPNTQNNFSVPNESRTDNNLIVNDDTGIWIL